jgi:hypothetical protein
VAPAAEFAGEAKDGLPATNSHGKNTRRKRRGRGTYLGVWKGGRGTGEGDRRRGAVVVAVLRGGRVVEREERKEGRGVERRRCSSFIERRRGRGKGGRGGGGCSPAGH